MNYSYQRFLLVLGTFGVAGVVFISFLASLAKQDPELATLPLGLTLVEHEGHMLVADAASAAIDYGLRPGDVIMCVDDLAISSEDRFREALSDKTSGDQINIGILRNGETLTINNRFHGAIEAPAVQPGAEPLAKTTSGPKRSEDKTPLQEIVAQNALAPSHQNTEGHATFGLEFQDREGKLTVTSVDPLGAAAAYGVQVGDVLYQVDRTAINSLADFHRVETGKSVGDQANLMLIRGDSIVLLPELRLGPGGRQFVAPADFVPTVLAISSFTQESLAELLDDPFKQFIPSVPKAPDFPSSPAVPAGPEVVESGTDVLDHEASEGVDSSELISADLVKADEPAANLSDSRVTRFADLPGDALSETELSKAPAGRSQPKTVPRFHKYSTIRLPDVPLAVGSEPMDWATIESSLLQSAGVTSRYDTGQVAKDPTRETARASENADNNPRLTGREPGGDVHSQLTETTSDLESAVSQPASDPGPSSDLVQMRPYSTHRVSLNQPDAPGGPSQTSAAPLPSPREVPRDGYETPMAGVVTEPRTVERSEVPTFPHAQASRGSLCAEGDSYVRTDCDSPGVADGWFHVPSASGVSVGGWLAVGYHSQSDDLFNDRPDKVALHQGWLYVEKAATAERPFGFRADLMYGIDGADTQAFGNDLGTWDLDNGFDHGAYAWAIPQLYADVAWGDWNIQAGHFFTKVGYEAVAAPENFFYSHAMTMYNSEPFTHTGILAKRTIGEDAILFAGWTLGWDTGFDQFNGGSSWLGGFGYQFHDDVKLTFMSTAGNFGARGEDAYSHSIVCEIDVTDELMWVVQSDCLRIQSTGEDNVGLNQYLLYVVNDKLHLGARVEWWKGDVLTGYAPHGGVLPAFGSLSYYAATFGVNYRPYKQIRLRPEVRIDWSPVANYEETYFGIDAMLTF